MQQYAWIWHDALAVIVALLGVWQVHKTQFEKYLKILPQPVQNVIENGLNGLEALAKSPWFAAEAAKGKVELKHVIDKVSHLTIVNEAKTILLSIGKAYNTLTPAEVIKAEYLLRLGLSDLRVTLTDQQVKDIFNEAQKAIDLLKSQPEFKAAFPEQPAQPQQTA